MTAVEVTLTSGNEPPVSLELVAQSSECRDDAFYVENHRVVLCSGACIAVASDAEASVDIVFPCGR